MIVDTSALVAVLFDEPDSERYATAMAQAARCRMSAANFLEAALVVEGRAGISGAQELDIFIETAEIEIVPVSVEQARVARRAWREFGKGNHPAGLNFGDCFAYALAKIAGEPILYKGDDFTLTDVESAFYRLM